MNIDERDHEDNGGRGGVILVASTRKTETLSLMLSKGRTCWRLSSARPVLQK